MADLSAAQIEQGRRVLADVGRWSSGAAFDRYYAALFAGVSFEGKRVLDVGGGLGTCSFLAALGGASEVLCLDPEGAGSRAGSGEAFQDLARRLCVDNARLAVATIQELQVVPASFDVIVFHNSINHIDEQACIDFQWSAAARAKYRAVFQKIGAIAAPGCDLIIADCTPVNLFAMLGLKHPISRSIEWEKHQPPELWAEELSLVGFEAPVISWTSYGRLGALGWRLTANRWGAFVLSGHFVLRMRRCS